MLELDSVSYSESAVVSAISGFYKFLTGMYLDEEIVEWPPEGGWPFTKKGLGSMEKSDRVVSLLRQLPYMQDALDGEPRPHGLPEAPFWNWKDNVKDDEPLDHKAAGEIKILTEDFLCDVTTPDLVGLLEGGKDAYENTVILLDTKYGIASWPECPDEIRETDWEQVQDNSEAWGSEAEVNWRCDAPAWTIPDFFAMLQEQFEQLRFIPVNSKQVINACDAYSDDGEMERMLQGIYREHGWPDLEKYRKEECIKAVEEALAEQYPDFELF
jgi:hypothetical protein